MSRGSQLNIHMIPALKEQIEQAAAVVRLTSVQYGRFAIVKENCRLLLEKEPPDPRLEALEQQAGAMRLALIYIVQQATNNHGRIGVEAILKAQMALSDEAGSALTTRIDRLEAISQAS